MSQNLAEKDGRAAYIADFCACVLSCGEKRLSEIITANGIVSDAGQNVRILDISAARIMAVFALAGELATEFNILPWKPGEASKACLQTFKNYLDGLGTYGQSIEDIKIFKNMTGFTDAHGNSRFQNKSKPDHYINNRAGFYYEKDEQTQYLFTASGVQINLVDLEKTLLKAARLGAEQGGQIVFDKLAVYNKEEACKRLGMSLPTLNKRIAERLSPDFYVIL